jgi:hypothetical protein
MLCKRVNVLCLFVACLALLAPGRARAQALVSARVLSSSGPVEINRRAQGQPALSKISYRAGDELAAGDVIKTFKGGRLVLGLTDGSQAIIGEQTIVEIADLSRSPRTIFNVLRGKTRVHIEKLGGRPNPYRVNTPTAVIAVRGTVFDVLVSGRETRVLVHEGEVAVSNLSSPGVQVILPPGWGTRVRGERPPESPDTFRPGRNDDTFEPRPQARRSDDDGPRAERGGDGLRSRDTRRDDREDNDRARSNERHDAQRDGDRRPLEEQ